MIVGILSLVAGLLGLVVAAMLYKSIVRRPGGDARMIAIGDEIHLGAMTYLRAQYTKIGIFALVVATLLFVSEHQGPGTAIAFLAGALTYAMSDFGMIKRPGGTSEAAHRARAARELIRFAAAGLQAPVK